MTERRPGGCECARGCQKLLEGPNKSFRQLNPAPAKAILTPKRAISSRNWCSSAAYSTLSEGPELGFVLEQADGVWFGVPNRSRYRSHHLSGPGILPLYSPARTSPAIIQPVQCVSNGVIAHLHTQCLLGMRPKKGCRLVNDN